MVSTPPGVYLIRTWYATGSVYYPKYTITAHLPHRDHVPNNNYPREVDMN